MDSHRLPDEQKDEEKILLYSIHKSRYQIELAVRFPTSSMRRDFLNKFDPQGLLMSREYPLYTNSGESEENKKRTLYFQANISREGNLEITFPLNMKETFKKLFLQNAVNKLQPSNEEDNDGLGTTLSFKKESQLQNPYLYAWVSATCCNNNRLNIPHDSTASPHGGVGVLQGEKPEQIAKSAIHVIEAEVDSNLERLKNEFELALGQIKEKHTWASDCLSIFQLSNADSIAALINDAFWKQDADIYNTLMEMNRDNPKSQKETTLRHLSQALIEAIKHNSTFRTIALQMRAFKQTKECINTYSSSFEDQPDFYTKRFQFVEWKIRTSADPEIQNQSDSFSCWDNFKKMVSDLVTIIAWHLSSPRQFQKEKEKSKELYNTWRFWSPEVAATKQYRDSIQKYLDQTQPFIPKLYL